MLGAPNRENWPPKANRWDVWHKVWTQSATHWWFHLCLTINAALFCVKTTYSCFGPMPRCYALGCTNDGNDEASKDLTWFSFQGHWVVFHVADKMAAELLKFLAKHTNSLSAPSGIDHAQFTSSLIREAYGSIYGEWGHDWRSLKDDFLVQCYAPTIFQHVSQSATSDSAPPPHLYISSECITWSNRRRTDESSIPERFCLWQGCFSYGYCHQNA